MGSVNYKYVVGASENAMKSEDGRAAQSAEGDREKGDDGFGRSAFSADAEGRTRWRWISSVRPLTLPFVRSPVRRSTHIHSHAYGGDGRDGDCVASSSSISGPPPFFPSLSLSARLCSASICVRVRANVTLDHLFRCA